jgi:CpeT protein
MVASDLLLTLAHWIAGDFSNQQQAFEDAKNYAHIHVFFRPLPWNFFEGIGFYSEQAYDYDLWRPYRQGVHRFIDRGDDIYIENYSLQNPMFYAGAGRELSILHSIKPEKIDRRYNCSMIFQREGNLFRGRVEGNSCFIEKYGKKTYLVSDVELTENTFVSFDRGLDVDTEEQVWGSTAGALKFAKIQNFAAEVPQIMT